MASEMIVATAADIEREAALARLHYFRERFRPCNIRAVDIECYLTDDGKEHYSATYGELMADGDTPAEACAAFDKLWETGGY